MKLTPDERLLVSHAKVGHWVDPAALADIIDRLTAAPENLREDTCPPRRCDSAGTGVGFCSLPPVGPALYPLPSEKELTAWFFEQRTEPATTPRGMAERLCKFLATGNHATLLRRTKSQPARVVERERLIEWLEGWTYFSGSQTGKAIPFADALLSSGIFVEVPSEEKLAQAMAKSARANEGRGWGYLDMARDILPHMGEKK